MVTLQIAQDAGTYEPATANFGQANIIGMIVPGSGAGAYAYLLPTGVPVGADVLIQSATLDLHASGAWAGAANIGARRVTASWSQNTITYANQPATTATGATSTAVNVVANGALVSLDVTAIVQAWASGQPIYGFRLDNSTSTNKIFHSIESTTPSLRPVLNVVASRKPAQPSSLSPAGGKQVAVANPTVSWASGTDPFGLQAAFKVQVASDVGFTAITEDSGWVTSTASSYALTVAVPNAATRFWRVYVRNSGGQESDASATATFGRTNKSALAITAPGATADDSTPNVTWTFGGTQTAWRVYFVQPGTSDTIATDANGSPIDSGWVQGTGTTWASTKSINAQTGGSRTVKVQVRDNVDRVSTATAGDTAETIASQSFTYAAGATTDATALTAAPHALLPCVELTWSRASTPDQFIIWRRKVGATDWVEIYRAVATDFFVAGTSYAWTDMTAAPRVAWEYAVVSSLVGVNSPTPPTAATTALAPKYIWLLDPDDDDWWLALADQADVGLQFTEDSEVSYIAGSPVPQVVFDVLRGYEGTVTGSTYESLPDLGGITEQSLRDRAWRIKQNPAHTFRLVLSDMNIPVIVRNLNVKPTPHAELRHEITFDAIQVGELAWS